MLHNWLADWKLVGRIFNTRKSATRRKRLLINKASNQAEVLEDRTLLSVANYTAGTMTLDFTADVGEADDVVISSPAANTIVIDVSAGGDTIVLAGDANAGNGFSLNGTNNLLTIDTSIAALVNFNINLGDMNDSLDFSLASSTNGVTNVTIDGQAGTVDAVVFSGNTTIGGALFATSESISQTGGTITAAELGLNAGTGLGTDNTAIDTMVGTLAAITQSGDIQIHNIGNLTIGTLNGIEGVQILDGDLTPNNEPAIEPTGDNSGLDNITLTASGSLTVNSRIINQDGGDIVLSAQNTGDVAMNADVQVTGDAAADDGQIMLTAGGHIIHNSGTVSTVSGSTALGDGQITYDADETIRVGDNLSMNNAAVVRTAGGNIVMTADPAAPIFVSGTAITFSDTATIAANEVLVESTSGNIAIDGTGVSNGATSSNRGVVLASGSIVRSTGTGAAIGTITIQGTGGNGDDFNHGVELIDIGTQVTTVDGDIAITGSAGCNLIAGSTSNSGVVLSASAVVSSTGTTVNAGAITLTGTGAGGTNSDGVVITDSGTLITSINGSISIDGTSRGAGADNEGIRVAAGAGVSSQAGPVSLNGKVLGSDPVNFGTLTPGNILVANSPFGNRDHFEYRTDGTFVQQFSGPNGEYRDLVVDSNGVAQIYNGTFNNVMTTFDPTTTTFTDTTLLEGWSTVNNLTYGGAAALGDFVFFTDMETANDGGTRGLI